jgi:hypothetical protein
MDGFDLSRVVGGRKHRRGAGLSGGGIGSRDPEAHLMTGELARERALEGGMSHYNALHKQSHRHMLHKGAGLTGGRHHHMGAGLSGGAHHMVCHHCAGTGVSGGADGGRHHKHHSMQGAGFWDDFKHGFDMVAKPFAKIAKPFIGALPYGNVANAGLSALGYGRKHRRGAGLTGGIDMDVGYNPDHTMEGGYHHMGAGLSGGADGGKHKRAKAGAHDGRRARAQIVKKVMAEKGLSLPMASKYVKEHGLY